MTSEKETLKNILGRLMGEAGKVLGHRMEQNLSEAGLDITAPQMILLKHVDVEEGVNQQRLTEHLCMDKTTVTRQIDALEGKNLVVRVPNKTDRRQNMLFLTNDGKKMMGPIGRIARVTEQQALQGIDPEHVTICKGVLKRVRKNLEDQAST